MSRPKFGDPVRGIWAGADNPQRDGVFVEIVHRSSNRFRQTYWRCTDGHGNFWIYPPENVIRLNANGQPAGEEDHGKLAAQAEIVRARQVKLDAAGSGA